MSDRERFYRAAKRGYEMMVEAAFRGKPIDWQKHAWEMQTEHVKEDWKDAAVAIISSWNSTGR